MNSDTLLSADTPLSDENNGDLLCSSAGETVPARVAPRREPRATERGRPSNMPSLAPLLATAFGRVGTRS